MRRPSARAGFELLQPGVADAVGGALDGAVDIGLDACLQRIHRGDPGQFAAQAMGYNRSEQPAERAGQTRKAETGQGAEERLIGQQACQHGGDFVVGVRSDGIEFAHHVLVVRLLGLPHRGHVLRRCAGSAIDRRL